MTVSRILAKKGRDVITTQPHRTLGEVARLLSEKGIGALIITGPGDEVLGIVSERDIVRAVARQGATALDDAVSRHMTAKVVTASENATVNSMMEQMTAGRFRHVPIVEGGRLVGLISIGDVVKSRLEEFEAEQQALKDYIATA
ncbi:MAG: CBS domain-containing protein [Beijerinckiaceae bacterium]|jgi:CBS domain-containing protein|nr:CBS domain-containing protein [Beijerinckiaceae bacterium]MDO9440382.1 CBS domain-containing protein [Beijerinckiaceae bacterium]